MGPGLPLLHGYSSALAGARRAPSRKGPDKVDQTRGGWGLGRATDGQEGRGRAWAGGTIATQE